MQVITKARDGPCLVLMDRANATLTRESRDVTRVGFPTRPKRRDSGIFSGWKFFRVGKSGRESNPKRDTMHDPVK